MASQVNPNAGNKPPSPPPPPPPAQASGTAPGTPGATSTAYSMYSKLPAAVARARGYGLSGPDGGPLPLASYAPVQSFAANVQSVLFTQGWRGSHPEFH